MVQEKETKGDNLYKVSDSVLLKLQQDIQEIKVALLGNEYNPTAGLLCRTSELEKELAKLKNRYDKITWMVVGASTVIGIVFNLIMKMLDKFVF